MVTKYLELKVILEPTLMKGVDYLAKVQGVAGVNMLRKLIQESLENSKNGSLRKNTPVRRIMY